MFTTRLCIVQGGGDNLQFYGSFSFSDVFLKLTIYTCYLPNVFLLFWICFGSLGQQTWGITDVDMAYPVAQQPTGEDA